MKIKFTDINLEQIKTATVEASNDFADARDFIDFCNDAIQFITKQREKVQEVLNQELFGVDYSENKKLGEEALEIRGVL